MRGHDQSLLLYAACFLVVAVVIVSLPDIERALAPAPPIEGFGPAALPFVCDFTRQGAGPDDMDGRFTLTFDATGDGPFPHCATLTRGTKLRPRSGTQTICLAHKAATPQDLWQDFTGGTLTIYPGNSATYLRRERAPGADAFAETTNIAYAGSCMRDV